MRSEGEGEAHEWSHKAKEAFIAGRSSYRRRMYGWSSEVEEEASKLLLGEKKIKRH
jgi:hypothetical protein